jgi:hypothetical protein
MTTAFVYTTFTWTGPLPTEVDTTCRVVQDTSGVPNKDAYVGEEFTSEGPSTEADRDGVLVLELPVTCAGRSNALSTSSALDARKAWA